MRNMSADGRIAAVMRLDRLAALVATVAPDRTSTVADAAAARWDLRPGTVRYVRTSAACVFATGDGYLRLQPTPEHRVEDIEAVTEVTAALARAGAPVAAPRASTSGRLTEVVREVPTTAGPRSVGLYASVIAAAPGDTRELEGLSTRDAVQWGRALGRLHQIGRTVPRTRLPTWPEVIRRAVGRHCDPHVEDVVEGLIQRCMTRLGPPSVLVHGDAQPDNAGWTATGPILFDLDDACVSWAAAELAMAVRDALPIDVLDTPATESAPARALLHGYRLQASFDPDEERLIPLMQRLSAALTYGRLRRATAPDSVMEPEPAWLPALRNRLLTIADQLRVALLHPEASAH